MYDKCRAVIRTAFLFFRRQSAQQFQNLPAMFPFLSGHTGKDLTVLRIAGASLILGKAPHLPAIASAQQQTDGGIVYLWR